MLSMKEILSRCDHTVLRQDARWEEILAAPEPPDIFPIARALWRYQRGVAATSESLVMRSRSGTVRRVQATHDRAKLRQLIGTQRYG